MLVSVTEIYSVNEVVSRMLTVNGELVISSVMLVLVIIKFDVVVNMPKLRLDKLVSVVQIVAEVVSVSMAIIEFVWVVVESIICVLASTVVSRVDVCVTNSVVDSVVVRVED